MKIILLSRVVVFLLLFASLAEAAERQILHGHVPKPAKSLPPLKRMEGTNQLELSIALPLRDAAGLNKLLEEIYDPSSARYHQYLTPQEFAKQFGPSEADYNALMGFAKSHNLAIVGTHPNRTLLDVRGSVAEIEKAFHVNMRVYKHPTERRNFHAPDTEPSLDLNVQVLSISGLDDFNLPRPLGTRFQKILERTDSKTLRGPLGNPGQASQSRPGSPTPKSDAISYATGSGPRATFMGEDFRTAYAPGVSLDGTGQTVGLFELDGYFPSDITEYVKLAGLPNVPITNVLVNGFNGRPGFDNMEVALDIDMVISMAPGLSKVIVYEGNAVNANAVLNRMATDNLAKQLSSSWGFGPQVDPAREQIFQQFAAQGQSMFQASGDLGAWPGAIAPPSDDVWLTVVGGTSLSTVTVGGAWQSETTWPGSGGGVSTSYTIPIWQQGIDMGTNQGSTTMRNVPDIAAHADISIWVIVNNGEEGPVGGTSAAAPLWAAFTALANQQAAASGKPGVGFLNPAIYAIGKGPTYSANFHDVTSGNNTNANSTNKFFAVPGFDLCTGWGTPNGSNLIASLVAPPDTLRISPAADFLASGPAGGPLIPVSQTYTLTNFGTAPVNWTLANTSLWLNASATGGTLVAGGPATNVIVSLNTAASNLVAGTYAATLLFTNVAEQTVQSRKFTLAVVTPPVITSQPVSQAVFEGVTTSFNVGTASNALLYYQWRRDGGSGPTNLIDSDNVSGAGTSSLAISNVSTASAGVYSVLVTNAAGVALSSNAALTIIPWHPVISTQPTNRTVLVGETATFAVSVTGSKPLFYQWQRGGTNLNDGGNISGTTTSMLTVGNVSGADVGTYAVRITNTLGSTTSSDATLAVISLNATNIILNTIYSFSGGNDGANPNGLTLGTNGILYGTTQHGGSNDIGTVFQLNSGNALTSLHSFSGESDGAIPFASLTQGADGGFYGTAFQGGAFDNGTVFRINTAGAFTNFVSLNVTNGDLPYAGLTLAADGNFYGATYQGGGGFGTIFRMTPSGQLTTIFSFGSPADGGFPHANLTQDADGNLYGTTRKSGPFNCGTVFKITTNGTLTTLVSFDNTNGAFPFAALARADDGNLYGTTAFGGGSSNGTIFKITPSGQFTNFYSFTGGNDGAQPLAGLFAAGDGNLYGTTAAGGAYGFGTVFRMLPNGTITNLVQFNGFNGANPQAVLADGDDGNLYGTTQNGGAYGSGTIFRIALNLAPQIVTPPASQTVFAGAIVNLSVAVIGGKPLSYQWKKDGVILTDGGNVSGSTMRTLTFDGVTTNNAGIYSVLVSNVLGSVQSADAMLSVTVSPPIITTQPTNVTTSPGATAIFAVNAIGNQPLSYQWRSNGFNLADAGKVSGSKSSTLTIVNATEGNNATYSVQVSNGLGSVLSTDAVLTVIPASAPGTRLTTLYSFAAGSAAYSPNGLTLGTNGVIYGTTRFGGIHGSIFTVNTNGTVTAPIVSFNGTNGSQPRAGLIQGSDGNLYGTTQYGGTNSSGSISRLDYDGSLSSLYIFPCDENGCPGGANPFAPLCQGADGNLYGATTQGGTDGFGTLFRISTNGVFTTLYSFTNGSDGISPTNGLIQATDGNFYGVTDGGASNRGNIFRMSPDGTVANFFTFDGGQNGGEPNALIQGSDGSFYGTTAHSSMGSFQFYGIIFRMNAAGQLGPLYPLNFNDGHYPAAGLFEASDGNFYGTTYNGGSATLPGNGTIFRIAPNGAFTTLASFDGFNSGANPASALIQGPDGALYGTTSTGGWGGRGTVFRLAYTSAAQIITQPANQAVWPGVTAKFFVTVAGVSPFSYQWRRNGTNLTDGANVSGATQRILTLANAGPADVATYSVVVSNALGTATSGNALLTLLSPPSFLSVGKVNNSLSLTWSTVAGQRYQLQYKTDLNSATWINRGIPRTATGSTINVSDPITSDSQRLYRVILLQ